ncbi:tryptophanyl-tRNA synthetase [Bradyrhizobium sp. RT11b]
MTIPGLDGRKMSKSYNNYIDIFQSDKGLKQVICRIVTDSTPVNEPKNPDQCSVFALYRAVASEQETVDMREQYLAGRIGYGAAKDQLYKMLLSKFGDQRERYSTLMSRPKIIEEALQAGETKARAVAQETIVAVRDHLGF